jgi:hypothetical protein
MHWGPQLPELLLLANCSVQCPTHCCCFPAVADATPFPTGGGWCPLGHDVAGTNIDRSLLLLLLLLVFLQVVPGVLWGMMWRAPTLTVL